MNEILIFAPGHDELDKRVLRTIKIFSKKFDRVVVVYESRFSLKREFHFFDNVDVLYVDDTKPFLKVFPKLNSFLKVFENVNIQNIYIHDSGLLGLLLVKKISRFLSNDSKIIFDYHDFISWEIHYQLSKLLKKSAVQFLGSKLTFLFGFYLRKFVSLDGIVGISEPQIQSLKIFLGYDSERASLAIPNTRAFIDDLGCNLDFDRSDMCDFLWVGNIVDGRDLPVTLEYLDQVYKVKKFNFYVFGKVISNSIFDVLSSKPYFSYLGEFHSDKDIFDCVRGKKIVALFFGWDDVFNVGINEIASPNKVYSYINVGVPVLLHEKVNSHDFSMESGIGEIFHDFDSFYKAVLLISLNYKNYRESVAKNRSDFIWDDKLDTMLEKFYHEIYFGVKS